MNESNPPPDDYAQRGYGGASVGFGERIGIAVVDFQLSFTDGRFPLGGSALTDRAVGNTATLLRAARAARLPVVSCYTAYHGGDAPHWKIPPVLTGLRHGAEEVQLDPLIHDPDYDYVLCKSAPSIFFQTAAAPIFVRNQVDTVIITGCTTSGCVRASIIDAFSFGFRVIVPEPCVGDVAEEPHVSNLRDVGRRYADIVDLETCLERITSLSRPNSL
jgi:maleamate amidohydrolase